MTENIDNEKNDNGKNHEKRTRVLFWIAGVATLVHLLLLSLEAIGKGAVTVEMTFFYFAVLGTYGGQNVLVRWKNPREKRKGELFVYAVWTYTALFYFVSVFLNKPDIIPSQLALTWQGVTVLFFGTSLSKMIKDFFFLKDK